MGWPVGARVHLRRISSSASDLSVSSSVDTMRPTHAETSYHARRSSACEGQVAISRGEMAISRGEMAISRGEISRRLRGARRAMLEDERLERVELSVGHRLQLPYEEGGIGLPY